VLPNTNRVEVYLHYGELTPLIQWCERNCIGTFAYDITDDTSKDNSAYYADFYFEDEEDLVAFTIWKT